MNTCLHVSQAAKLSPPAAFSKVYKEECTLCFAGTDSSKGLDVCLSCFNGSCQSTGDGGGGGRSFSTHSVRHYRKTGHCLVLNIQRKRASRPASPSTEAAVGGEEGKPRTSKMQKVEILPEAAEPQQEDNYTVRCLICASQWTPDSLPSDLNAVAAVIKGIVESSSAQKRIEVQAWREEEVPCEHTRQLQQERTTLAHRMTPRDQCGKCTLQENLWLCLVCGAIGCGRRQFDGSGGNGHGAEHYEETGHTAAVKLGTITPEGTADVHCYVCGEMRVDPKLGEHLAAFGIDTSGVERTEKTMAELQLEQNLKFDFSMLSADGHELEPAQGPGLRGLKNLGNSCYVSSVVQSLFTLPPFREAYVANGQQHIGQCQRDPAACFTCQSVKLASAIWAERQEGSLAEIRDDGAVAPWMFKAVVASGHAEFVTSRQQDASEFLAYLLKVIQRSDPQNAAKLVNPFTFSQQQSLTCSSCGHTRHQHSQGTLLTLQLSQVLQDNDATVQDSLPLDDFLSKNFAADAVQASCSQCRVKQQQHHRRMELIGLSDYLIVSLSRYVVRNWVPQKIDMAVEVPFDGLDLSRFVGEQRQVSKPEEPAVDEAVVTELMAMGFPRAKCRRALLKTDNQGIEAAMNWILEHGDDTAEVEGGESSSGADPAGGESISPELIQVLVEAGFVPDRARRALKETGGDVERAFDWILSHPEEEEGDSDASTGSVAPPALATGARGAIYDLAAFISHKGPSIHCGHYIAHIRNPQKPGQWIMCNDERIAVADPQPPVPAARAAYIYIYRRRRKEC